MSFEAWNYHIRNGMVETCKNVERVLCPAGGSNGKQNHYFLESTALIILKARQNDGQYPIANCHYSLMDFDEILETANESASKAQAVYEEILQRTTITSLLGSELEHYVNASEKSTKTLKEIRAILNDLKNTTARMVEAYTQSSNFVHTYEDHDFETVGDAKMTTSFDPNTLEWLEARYDTIGGSDVSNLVVSDFTAPVTFFARKQLEKTVDSKTQPVEAKDIHRADYSQEDNKRGPLYRGTVWEPLSRELFAQKFPQYKVFNTKHQYKNIHRDYQQVNFDGLLSDRTDGSINGILELKTGMYLEHWKDGVPLGYRAQVLYYLNSTGLDYAMVAVLINDGTLLSYRLNATDAVAPGKFEGTMNDYIEQRVEPWFAQVKALRA